MENKQASESAERKDKKEGKILSITIIQLEKEKDFIL
jgi:hypothetical protein